MPAIMREGTVTSATSRPYGILTGCLPTRIAAIAFPRRSSRNGSSRFIPTNHRNSML